VTDQNAFWETVAAITQSLRERNISFQLTGGIAASYYGEPRMTQDVDIVIQLDTDLDVSEFCQQFPERFPVDDTLVREALREGSLFQVVDQKTFFKVDLHIGELVPGEMARSREVRLSPDLTVPLISKEGAILSKLHWIRLGSHKSRRDVLMILLGDDPVDEAYLKEQAYSLGLSELLEEMQQKAAEQSLR
jgi:hypothetical protein